MTWIAKPKQKSLIETYLLKNIVFYLIIKIDIDYCLLLLIITAMA